MSLTVAVKAVKTCVSVGNKVQNYNVQSKIMKSLDSYYQLTRQGQSSIDELSQKIDKLDSKADLIAQKTDALIIRDLLAANLALDDIKAAGVLNSSELLQLKNMYRVNTGLLMDETTCGISNSQIRVMSYFGLFQIGILENADEKLLTRYILHMFATGEPVVSETLFPQFYDEVFSTYINKNRRAALFETVSGSVSLQNIDTYAIRYESEKKPALAKQIAKDLLEKGYVEALSSDYQELENYYQEKAKRLGLDISRPELDLQWVSFIKAMSQWWNPWVLYDDHKFMDNLSFSMMFKNYLNLQKMAITEKAATDLWSSFISDNNYFDSLKNFAARQFAKNVTEMVLGSIPPNLIEDMFMFKMDLREVIEKQLVYEFSKSPYHFSCTPLRLICLMIYEVVGTYHLVNMMTGGHRVYTARDIALSQIDRIRQLSENK